MGDELDEILWASEEDYGECDLCGGDSDYAFQGFGSICLEKYGCEEWAGDGMCMIAIDRSAIGWIDYELSNIPKPAWGFWRLIKRKLKAEKRALIRGLQGRYCPLECPNCF